MYSLIKILAIAVAFLGASNASAAIGNPCLTVGGVAFFDCTTLKQITAYDNGTNNSTARLATGSSGYTPSATKDFCIHAASCTLITTGSTTALPLLGYSDNDVGVSTATAITNQVRWNGGASTGYQASIGSARDSTLSRALEFTIPNGKYCTLLGIDSAPIESCTFYGYEKATGTCP